MTNFVMQKDIDYLETHGINYTKDISTFLDEIKDHFNMLDETNLIENIATIDELNKDHLLCYPSTGGYYILEDSFSYPSNLSKTSKIILGYFYGISLR
tara:strand:- start:314 stop:607 length:294 start_codon:yes stop_codon:yes gene_type:complete